MKSNRRAKRLAKQLLCICHVEGLLDEDRTRQVVKRVIASGRRDCPAILAHFLRLVRLDLAQHAANVESAGPLSAGLQSAIQASLLRRYGSGLNMTFTLRPSLIGGVRIQVGSDVYDGSVLARLTAFEKGF
jgi:F-type H+-transporting ATPase subunit delta